MNDRFQFPVATSHRSRLVVDLEITPAKEGSRVSLCGSHDSTDGGGGGGQIVDSLAADAAAIAAEPGGMAHLTPVEVAELVRLWHRWHLNDMRPGCEHQTGPEWDVSQVVEFPTFSIEWDDRRTIERQRDRDAEAAGFTSSTEQLRPFGSIASAYGPLTPSNREAFRRFSHAETLLAALNRAGVKPFTWATVSGRTLAHLSDLFEIIGEHQRPEYLRAVALQGAGEGWTFNGKRRASWINPKPPILQRTERKTAGWIYPKEHPAGLLTKPCAVCGYKYGSEWRKERCPDAVLDRLREIATKAGEAPDASANLHALGFSLDVAPGKARAGWAADARHWRVTIKRGAQSMAFAFSQGSAHTEPPTLADVFDCLRSDAQLAQDEDELVEVLSGGKERPRGLLAKVRECQEQAAKFSALCGEDCEALGVSR